MNDLSITKSAEGSYSTRERRPANPQTIRNLIQKKKQKERKIEMEKPEFLRKDKAPKKEEPSFDSVFDRFEEDPPEPKQTLDDLFRGKATQPPPQSDMKNINDLSMEEKRRILNQWTGN